MRRLAHNWIPQSNTLREYLSGMKHSNPPAPLVEDDTSPYHIFKCMTKLFPNKSMVSEETKLPKSLEECVPPSFLQDNAYQGLRVLDPYGEPIGDNTLLAMLKGRFNVPAYVHFEMNKTFKFGRSEPIKPRVYLSSITLLATEAEIKRAIAGDSGIALPLLAKPQDDTPPLLKRSPRENTEEPTASKRSKYQGDESEEELPL